MRPLPFETISVASQEEGASPLIRGEKYKKATVGETGTEYVEGVFEYYGLHYPANGDEAQFFRAFEEAIAPALRKMKGVQQSPAEIEAPMGGESPFWREGIVIATDRDDVGNIGLPLQQYLERGNWQDLQGEALQQLLRTRIQVEGAIPVAQYRLNTPLGDFAFDVTPEEDEEQREVHVLSHRNIAPQVASLYRLTNTGKETHADVEALLDEQLKDFSDVEAA